MIPRRLLPHPLLAFAALAGEVAAAKPAYPPVLPDAREETYKTAGEAKLKLWIFSPQEPKSSGGKKPAVVFFFGGGWRSGNPAQFAPQCRYLASRGVVAVTADYRVSTRHGTKATACVEDGKSAVRWMRANAERLGVDPNKIAAGGGSAGGHVAAAVGTVPGFEAKGEDHTVSSRPDALLLFNPAVLLASVPEYKFPPEKDASRRERAGTDPMKISPYHHLAKEAPPTLIFHGKKDDAVDFRTVRLYEKQAKKLGALCKLHAFEDMPHGFFNWGRFDNKPFRDTMLATDQFLAELGWLRGLKGKPSIDAFIKANR